MFVVYAIGVILLFSVTIFVHELGHYLAARLLGLVVDVFSIGFGPAIVKKTIGGIVYKVGCLPVGGYVALPQLDPGGAEDADGNKRNLPAVKPWKKIIVAGAGAGFNILFAILLAYVVYWGGRTMVHEERDCVVGYVATNSAAFAAGMQPGDIIEGLNGAPVNRWDDFMLEAALADQVELSIRKKDDTLQNISLPTVDSGMGGRYVEGVAKHMPCLIIGIIPNSSAQQAGLEARDIIREFAGQPIYSVSQLTELVNNYSGVETPVTVRRDGTDLTLNVTPKYDEKLDRALIGIEFNPFDIYKTPMDQMKSWSMPVFRLLKKLVTPSSARKVAGAVGGPVAIFSMIWSAVQASLLLALWFTGMLNVNLAILNLLPIPVLDGGHIVFSLWEMITRRPVHEKVVNTLANVFGALLILAIVLVTINDFRRLVLPRFFGSKDEPAAIETNSVPEAEATTE